MGVTTISPVQILLDEIRECRRKHEAANCAVFDAMLATMDFNPALAPILFGTTAEFLGRLTSIPKNKLRPVLMSGIPFFRLCVSQEFVNALDGEERDVALNLLLKSYTETPPVNVLHESFIILNAHDPVLRGIEAANIAIMDAARAVAALNDPLGSNMLGCPDELLRQLAEAGKYRLSWILMSCLPLFRIRLSSDLIDVIEDNGGKGVMLDTLLRTFEVTPPTF